MTDNQPDMPGEVIIMPDGKWYNPYKCGGITLSRGEMRYRADLCDATARALRTGDGIDLSNLYITADGRERDGSLHITLECFQTKKQLIYVLMKLKDFIADNETLDAILDQMSTLSMRPLPDPAPLSTMGKLASLNQQADPEGTPERCAFSGGGGGSGEVRERTCEKCGAYRIVQTGKDGNMSGKKCTCKAYR